MSDTPQIASNPRMVRMCANKHTYPDKRAAMTVLNHISRSRGRDAREKGMHVYACDYCDGWHMAKGSRGRDSIVRTAQKKPRKIRRNEKDHRKERHG